KILFVGNLTATDIEEKDEVKLGSNAIAGTWRDAFTGEILKLGSSASFDLKSWKYRLLVSVE
ncbi:MAG TPA: hypothetical protein VK995_05570, partial [Oceanipulchritudo sp.]|nr:hypothetical protein [Oceanipulchritudo sp.]